MRKILIFCLCILAFFVLAASFRQRPADRFPPETISASKDFRPRTIVTTDGELGRQQLCRPRADGY